MSTTCPRTRSSDRDDGSGHQSRQKIRNNQSRNSFKRKILLYKIRRSVRQVPLVHLRKRARLVKSSANWPIDSGNFHDSARALASCLQNRNVSRTTDQSMIEAAKCMFHKSLGEARDVLERVAPQQHESLCSETPSEKPVLAPRHQR